MADNGVALRVERAGEEEKTLPKKPCAEKTLDLEDGLPSGIEQAGDEKKEDTLKREEKKKRSRKRTLVIFSRVLLASGIVIVYILLGALVVHLLESPAEIQRLENAASISTTLRQEMIDILYNATNNSNTSTELTDRFITNITNAVSKGAFARWSTDWEYEQSIFFAMTVVTTIGFGNVNLQTEGGRVFIVFYALIGIPLTVIFLANVGKLLSRIFKTCLKPFSRYLSVLVISYVFLLGLGLIIVVCIPAVVFAHVEGWNFEDAVYFCFISLSTIGFGDIVVLSNDDNPASKVDRAFYTIFIFIWVFVGLAYLTIIIQEFIVAFSLLWKKIAMKLPWCRIAAAEEGFEERPLEKLAAKAGRRINRLKKTIRHNRTVRRTLRYKSDNKQ